MSRPRRDGRELSAARTEVVEQLRAHIVQFEENVRHLGTWMGLSASDATALAEVIWAETSHQPMTPARLSQRIGMSSGSTTALIDRLESGGHLLRSRESTDRRVVTLRPTKTSLDRAQEFFDTPAALLHTALNTVSDETAAQCAALLKTLVATLTESNRRFRAESSPPRRPAQ